MFFIHGGGFTSGYANADLYGPNFLVEKNIIFVTANYRLGTQQCFFVFIILLANCRCSGIS